MFLVRGEAVHGAVRRVVRAGGPLERRRLGTLAKLGNRVLSVLGPDAAKFLNGLVTLRMLPSIVKKNAHTVEEPLGSELDIDLASNWGMIHEDIRGGEGLTVTRLGVYSMVLNSKGRILLDVWVYPRRFAPQEQDPAEPAYLLDVPLAFALKLALMFKVHKLRADVRIAEEPGLRVYQYTNSDPDLQEFVDNLQEAFFTTTLGEEALHNAAVLRQSGHLFAPDAPVEAVAIDSRLPDERALRFVAPDAPVAEVVEHTLNVDPDAAEVAEEALVAERWSRGLVEYSDVAEQINLPFEMNLDYVNGLLLDKGCYVGQELTIRLITAGVIRKRCVPAEVVGAEDPAELVGKHIEGVTKAGAKAEPAAGAAPGASPFGAAAVRPRRRNNHVGRVVAASPTGAVALIGVESLGAAGEVREFPIEGSSARVRVWRPEWWPQEAAPERLSEQ